MPESLLSVVVQLLLLPSLPPIALMLALDRISRKPSESGLTVADFSRTIGSSEKLVLLYVMFEGTTGFGSWESRNEDMDGALLQLEVLGAGVYGSMSTYGKLCIRNVGKRKGIFISYLENLRQGNSHEACY